MANEGIMALPGGMDMPAEEAQNQQPLTVTSAESYDAAQTALGMVNPGDQIASKQVVQEAIGDLQLTQEEIDTLLEVVEYLSQNPGKYDQVLQQLIQEGIVEQGDLPDQYDPEFMGTLLIVLNEVQSMRGQGAMEPMQMSPTVEGLAPIGMAEGGLADVASYLASQGRNGDSMLAHITPEEAELLRSRGGSGTINPVTGLPEFFIKKAFKAIGKAFKSVANVVKKIAKSPIGRIIATVALATVLGPTAIGAFMGPAGTAALASGTVTLAGGGSLKEALISGAMGYIGGGGTIMGTNPLAAVGKYMPGLAGSALNTGFSTGVIAAGIGKLGGMSTQDALRMGLTSGATAGAMQGARNSGLIAEGRVTKEDIQADGTPAQGTGRFAGINDAGPTSAPGAIGTASELVSGSAVPPGTTRDLMGVVLGPNDYTSGQGLNPTRFSGDTLGLTGRPGGANIFTTASSYGPENFSAAAGGTGDVTNYGLSPSSSNYEPRLSVRSPYGMEGSDFSRAAGGTGASTNYGLMPRATGAAAAPGAAGPGAAAPGAAGPGAFSPLQLPPGAAPEPGMTVAGSEPGFLERMATGAKDLYGEYLSPDRPGLPADAGILRKYGPLMGAGLAATAAFGGMKGEPANQNPAFNRDYTGDDYIRDNPSKFSGGLDLGYVPPNPPRSPIVETPSYASIPIGAPGMVTPGGITNSPGGVAQPYNVAGLYGVPLIYGPDGRPQRLAKGGQPQPTYFPRKNGPINGPGTGTSDDIPAMLSDGEFVFTAKAVRNAGGGSRRKGAARMYKLMKKLEGGAV